MKIGRVSGSVVATRKDEKLEQLGSRFAAAYPHAMGKVD